MAHASAICLYELSRDMDKPKKVARDSDCLCLMVCTNQSESQRQNNIWHFPGRFGARARGQQLSMAQDYEVDSTSQQLC